jgi:hypothetical protein
MESPQITNTTQSEMSAMDRLGVLLEADGSIEKEKDDEPKVSDAEGVEEDGVDQGEEPQADEGEELAAEGEEGAEVAPEEVEIDGKLYQVPPEIKAAIMRNSDYTQKNAVS